jgi:hypothetical protein
VGDRVGRDGEYVGGRGEERERDVLAFGQQARGQRVDRTGDADVGRAVGVDIVAEHQRALDVGQPVGDRRDVAGQVEARTLRQALAGLGVAVTHHVLSDRAEQGPPAALRRF